MQRQETANQYSHTRPNYVVIYLTSLNIFLGSFKHVFNCTGWVTNGWNKSLDSSYALWAWAPRTAENKLGSEIFPMEQAQGWQERAGCFFLRWRRVNCLGNK